MADKIYHKFMHLVLFITSLILIWLKITTSTSINQLLVSASARYNCIDKERDALLVFKAHLQDEYGLLSTWTSEKECCKWNGITCNNQTGHVIRLELSDENTISNLKGKISPALANLSYLSHLDLSWNSFNGTIPMFIGSMIHLTYLDLSFNSFSGTIPASIGSLTKLTYLDLSYNPLLNGTCIPPYFGNLTNLQYLLLANLTSCKIGNIDWLSHMSDLNKLKMDGTSLANVNKWVNVILSLHKLSYLSLSGCDLSHVTLPYSSSFVNSSSFSSSIDTLNLDDNNLNSSMYQWLLPLTSNKLRNLHLSKNMLDGKSFGNVCSLRNLYFSYNSVVVSLPNFLNNWSRCTSVVLLSLDASYSRFTGSLSDQIQMFSSLKYLYLDHNELNGAISEKVWELPKLQTLDISSNYISVAISESIGRSKHRDVVQSNNTVKGVLSKAHMPNFSYVEHLDVSSCNLGPRFPYWIQNIKHLTWLNIAYNKISDTIPVDFWNNWYSQLTYLNLSTNNITGEVPDLLSNFDPNSFSKIDLSSNNLYGHIQNVPYNLAYLDLSGNKFHGGISFLCQISSGFLRYLDLSHNSFTGELPDCLWHFQELEVLNLGYNNLSGRLPASLKYLIVLEVLSLYNNNFYGELPLSLESCRSLTFLDLGANKFTGTMPLWIGESLSMLYVLSLASNKITGPIPIQLCQLAYLQILDLSMNNLYGTIPSCINNLTTMVQEGVFYKQNLHEVLNPDTPSITYTIDHAMIYWQGNIHEFSTNLGLFKGIDLSGNNLTRKIPYELTDLHGLIALNLSKNALLGMIPWKIGEMRNLLALDISRNNLSGEIPPSICKMNSLDYLDISYNNLSGRIPSSTQLQSFEPSKYIGNAGLCGLPLTKYCPGDEGSEVPPMVAKSVDDRKEIDDLGKWFYIGSATGFPVGFWIACGTLLLNQRARHAFLRFLDSLQDMVYVEGVLFIAKLKRFFVNSYMLSVGFMFCCTTYLF